MSWTGNKGSSRLMMLAMIICRCEWSKINRLGAKLEWQKARNGNDQTGGNIQELYKTFTEVKQQDEVREKNAAAHSPLCVSGQIRKCTRWLCRDLGTLLTWNTKLKHWIVYPYFIIVLTIGQELQIITNDLQCSKTGHLNRICQEEKRLKLCLWYRPHSIILLKFPCRCKWMTYLRCTIQCIIKNLSVY